jgi:hypothetical protein
MTTRLRSASAFAAMTLLIAGCSEVPLEPGPSSAQRAVISSTLHQVNVTVSGSGVVPGVLVTATNTATGDYLLAFTDANGVATFSLGDGPYLFHARNLTDAGPAFPELGNLQLALAPLPDGLPLLNTTTQGVNHMSALYTAAGSIPLTASNYSSLTQAPPVVLFPSLVPQVRNLNIAFGAGATVACNLVDTSGNPVYVDAPENVFMILPVAAGLPMPPVPQPLQGLGLPRGILTTAGTVATGSNTCSLAGIGATPPAGAIVETNAVPLFGKDYVFINAVPVSTTQAGQGETVPTLMVAEPRRSFTHYVPEPFGDNPGTTDLGLVTGGWLIENGAPTDEFVVAARFRGLGQYILEIRYNNGSGLQTHQIRATCSERDRVCRLNSGGPRLPDGLVISVEGTHTFLDGHATGTVIWRLYLPGVTEVDVLVFTGQPGKYDTAPDGSQPTRMKKGGNGNTWIIPS